MPESIQAFGFGLIYFAVAFSSVTFLAHSWNNHNGNEQEHSDQL